MKWGPYLLKLSSVVVAVADIVIICAYLFLSVSLAPFDHIEDKTLNMAAQNVSINAATFNGDI